MNIKIIKKDKEVSELFIDNRDFCYIKSGTIPTGTHTVEFTKDTPYDDYSNRFRWHKGVISIGGTILLIDNLGIRYTDRLMYPTAAYKGLYDRILAAIDRGEDIIVTVKDED